MPATATETSHPLATEEEWAEFLASHTPAPEPVPTTFAEWWSQNEKALTTAHYDGSKWGGVFFLAQAAFDAGKASA